VLKSPQFAGFFVLVVSCLPFRACRLRLSSLSRTKLTPSPFLYGRLLHGLGLDHRQTP